MRNNPIEQAIKVQDDLRRTTEKLTKLNRTTNTAHPRLIQAS
jgi:hypothetical protein